MSLINVQKDIFLLENLILKNKSISIYILLKLQRHHLYYFTKAFMLNL